MAQILSEGGVKPTPWNIRGPRDPRIREEWRWAWGSHLIFSLINWRGGGSPRPYAATSFDGDAPQRATGSWVRSQKGLAYDIGTSDNLEWSARSEDDLTEDVPLAMFVAVNRTVDFDSTNGILVHRSGFSSGYHGLGLIDTELAYFLHDGSLNTVSSGQSVDLDRGYHTYGVVREVGGTFTFVIDGQIVSGGTNATIPGSASHTLNVGQLQENSTGNSAPGEYLAAYYWKGSPGVTTSRLQDLHRAPFGWIRPRERDVVQVLTAGTTVTVGQATETDTSQSVGSAKSQSVGQPSESDSAFSVTAAKTVSVGQPTSTAAAQAVSAAKTQAVGLASESDASLAAGAAKAQSVGLTTETDSALAVTAGTATVVSVGQASETDSAQAVSSAKSQSVGQATESDLALSVTPVRVLTLGQASEVDTAQAVDIARTVSAGLAVESDQTFSVQVAKLQSVGQATETDEALAVVVAGAPIGLMGPFTMFGESLDRTMTGESIFRTMSDEDTDRTMSGEE